MTKQEFFKYFINIRKNAIRKDVSSCSLYRHYEVSKFYTDDSNNVLYISNNAYSITINNGEDEYFYFKKSGRIFQ